MSKNVDIDGEPPENDAEAEKTGGRNPDAGKRNPEEMAVPAGEEGQPLVADDDANGHEHFRTRPVYKRPAFLIGAIIVLLVMAVFGIRYWLYARSHESTDDAFVDGHIIQVSPKASGYVARVYITDNQQVKAGDLLVELDARDYEANVAQAKAALDAGLAQQHQAQTQVTLTRVNTKSNLQQAAAGVRVAGSGVQGAQANAAAERSRISQASAAVSTARANVDQSLAQLSSALAEAARANNDVRRYQELYNKDEVSRQQLDAAVAAARTADAQVESARQKVTASEAQVNEARSAESAQTHTALRAQTQITGPRLR